VHSNVYFVNIKEHSSNEINIVSVSHSTHCDRISFILDRPAVAVWQQSGCQGWSLMV
jgi:hypothetical protein